MDCFKILIVDDEKFVRRTISRVLSCEGMATFEAGSGPEALHMVKQQSFDLIILDIVMDDMDGFEVIRRLREQGVLTPVFVLSGRQADNDKVFALGIGADDYVTKPFSTSVLCAKVKACLRRSYLTGSSLPTSLRLGPFCYIPDEMRLLKDGVDLQLSTKESLMARYFMQNPGKVLSKDQIYSHVWGDNIVDDNTIMVHIRRLRQKLEEDPNQPCYLRTVRGVGYQFMVTNEK